jgi:hypothetical protein
LCRRRAVFKIAIAIPITSIVGWWSRRLSSVIVAIILWLRGRVAISIALRSRSRAIIVWSWRRSPDRDVLVALSRKRSSDDEAAADEQEKRGGETHVGIELIDEGLSLIFEGGLKAYWY